MVSSRFSYGFVFCCCCCFSNLQVVQETGKVVVTVATTQKVTATGTGIIILEAERLPK